MTVPPSRAEGDSGHVNDHNLIRGELQAAELVEAEVVAARGGQSSVDARLDLIDTAVSGKAATAHSHNLDSLSDVDTSSVAPTDGQALVWDNVSAKWEPGTVVGGGGVSDHGALTGLADDDHAQYALADGTRGAFAAVGHNHTGTYDAAGTAAALVDDLSGVSDAATARTNLGLGGAAVLSVGTTSGTVAAGDDARLSDTRAPSGTAGGDLSGSYPNPSVAKVGGVSISGTPSVGQVPTATSGTAATWQTPAAGGSGMKLAPNVTAAQGLSPLLSGSSTLALAPGDVYYTRLWSPSSGDLEAYDGNLVWWHITSVSGSGTIWFWVALRSTYVVQHVFGSVATGSAVTGYATGQTLTGGTAGDWTPAAADTEYLLCVNLQGAGSGATFTSGSPFYPTQFRGASSDIPPGGGFKKTSHTTTPTVGATISPTLTGQMNLPYTTLVAVA